MFVSRRCPIDLKAGVFEGVPLVQKDLHFLYFFKKKKKLYFHCINKIYHLSKEKEVMGSIFVSVLVFFSHGDVKKLT